MVLFFIGIIEMLIITVWTKMVTETKVLASGMVTVFNILVWYYVLQTIIQDISNFQLVIMYALGCAVGTMASTYYFSLREKKQSEFTELQKQGN